MDRQGKWKRQHWKEAAVGKDGDSTVNSIPAVSAEILLDKTVSKSLPIYSLIVVSNLNETGDPDVPT